MSGRTGNDAIVVYATIGGEPPDHRHTMPGARVDNGVPPRTPLSRKIVERAGSLVHTTFSLTGRQPARGRGKAA